MNICKHLILRKVEVGYIEFYFLPLATGAFPQVLGRIVRVLFQVHNALATCVQKQLHARHTRTCRHVCGVNGVDVATLEQSILLSVDSLATIKVRTTRCVCTRASMWMDMSQCIEFHTGVGSAYTRTQFIAVRLPSCDTVVPSAQHVAPSIQQHTTDGSPQASPPLRCDHGHRHGPCVSIGAHWVPTNECRHQETTHATLAGLASVDAHLGTSACV